MARTIPPALLTALQNRTAHLCLCWKVVRALDGLTLGFTDHDQDVTFGSVTYKASTSFVGSAIQDQLGLAVTNVDAMGAFSSDAITNDDLEDGRWDGSAITLYVADWTSPTTGNAILMKGEVGQVTAGDVAFQTEIRSLGQHFQQYVGSLVQENCRSVFGATGTGLESGCNFTLPAAVSGTIASVTSRSAFKVTAAGSFPDGGKGSLSGGYFAFGYVSVTTGANAGLKREVFTSDSSLNFVTLLPFPEDFAVGDAVTLQIGCDKTMEVCIANYNNILNFRGEPYVPGTDFIFRVNS